MRFKRNILQTFPDLRDYLQLSVSISGNCWICIFAFNVHPFDSKLKTEEFICV